MPACWVPNRLPVGTQVLAGPIGVDQRIEKLAIWIWLVHLLRNTCRPVNGGSVLLDGTAPGRLETDLPESYRRYWTE